MRRETGRRRVLQSISPVSRSVRVIDAALERPSTSQDVLQLWTLLPWLSSYQRRSRRRAGRERPATSSVEPGDDHRPTTQPGGRGTAGLPHLPGGNQPPDHRPAQPGRAYVPSGSPTVRHAQPVGLCCRGRKPGSRREVQPPQQPPPPPPPPGAPSVDRPPTTAAAHTDRHRESKPRPAHPRAAQAASS